MDAVVRTLARGESLVLGGLAWVLTNQAVLAASLGISLAFAVVSIKFRVAVLKHFVILVVAHAIFTSVIFYALNAWRGPVAEFDAVARYGFCLVWSGLNWSHRQEFAQRAHSLTLLEHRRTLVAGIDSMTLCWFLGLASPKVVWDFHKS